MISGTAITMTLTSVHTGSHHGPSAFESGASMSISGYPSCPLDADGSGQTVEAAGGRMRRGDAHDARRHAGIDLGGEHRFAAALPNLDLSALVDAELVDERLVDARPRRLR